MTTAGSGLSAARATLAFTVLALAFLVFGVARADAAAYGPNLVVNGDAETAIGAEWTSTTGALSEATHGAGGFPNSDIIGGGTFAGGLKLFYGGSTATMAANQVINLSPADLLAVQAGGVKSSLNAYIGGFSTQEDNLGLEAEWQDAGNTTVMTQVLDPVTNVERHNKSGFLPRENVSVIPATATHVVINLTGTRVNGAANDGYIDNIQLQLVTGNFPTLIKQFNPTPVAPGAVSTLTVTVDNSAEPAGQTGWSLVDGFQAGLVVAPTPNAATTCTNGTVNATAGDDFISAQGDVAANSTCQITVDVLAAAAGDYVNDASNVSVVGLQKPAGPATLHVADPADVEVKVTPGPATAVPGQPLTYTLTGINNGPGTADNVTITVDIPPELEIVSLPPGCTAAGHKVTCTIPSLPGGSQQDFPIVTRVPQTATGPLVATGEITSDNPDPTPANNKITTSTPVQPGTPSTLTVTTNVSDKKVGEGDKTTITVGVKNNGPGTLKDVKVCDRIPKGLVYVSSKPKPSSMSNGLICWTIPSLAPGETAKIKIKLKALASAKAKKAVNRVSATAPGAAGGARAKAPIRIRAARSRAGGVTG